ncbi:cysteine hydrolase family protein [Lactovum odontotermitis]
MKQALLIIDVQNDYFSGGKSELHRPLEALHHIEKILADFRKKSLPVIHIQHINTRQGATFFLPDTDGAKIHEKLTPLENEFVVTKHFPDSFLGTELEQVLQEQGITELVVCGMMSHMCIDTTVRACMNYGIKVTLLSDACATKDLIFEGQTIPAETVHQVFMASLQGMFATVLKTADVVSSID